jgi:hypothetical protein
MKPTKLAVAGLLMLSLTASRSFADGPLTTQDFENGNVTMEQAADGQLQEFLADLQSRRDYDAECHNGNAGPDADYLNGWITKTTDELKARGFTFDDKGKPTPPI